MMVTADRYELPIAVADSSHKLAIKVGRTWDSVRSGISRSRKGIKSEFVFVEVDDFDISEGVME